MCYLLQTGLPRVRALDRSSIWTTLQGCSHAFKLAVWVALWHSLARCMLGPHYSAQAMSSCRNFV